MTPRPTEGGPRVRFTPTAADLYGSNVPLPRTGP